jgi:hypothetical protein
MHISSMRSRTTERPMDSRPVRDKPLQERVHPLNHVNSQTSHMDYSGDRDLHLADTLTCARDTVGLMHGAWRTIAGKGPHLSLHNPLKNPHRLIEVSGATSNRCACAHLKQEPLKKSLYATLRSDTKARGLLSGT